MSTLYKYRSYSARALEMLINRQVYFASPNKLNDPYDCRLSIRAALREAIQKSGDVGNSALQERLERLQKIDHVYERMEAYTGSVGVLSLSRTAVSALMWAHYSANHAGFCMGFNLPDRLTSHLSSEGMIGATDVNYCTTNPFSDYFEQVMSAASPPSWEEFWMTLISTGLVAKAHAWNYEKEVRVIRRQPGAVAFLPAELTDIVFGLNMPSEDRGTVRRLLSAQQWSHVRFREIIRSESFDLHIVDVAAT